MGPLIGNYSYTFPCAVNILHPPAVPAQPVLCENHHATLLSSRQVDLRDTDARKGALRSYKTHPSYLSLVILIIAGFKKNILCNRRYFFALFSASEFRIE